MPDPLYEGRKFLVTFYQQRLWYLLNSLPVSPLYSVTNVNVPLKCVCVYSNSRNDVPQVAQRYGTIAAHTRRRASVLVVFVVFCVHV